jgi:DNA-binding transcriptional MerR regulator
MDFWQKSDIRDISFELKEIKKILKEWRGATANNPQITQEQPAQTEKFNLTIRFDNPRTKTLSQESLNQQFEKLLSEYLIQNIDPDTVNKKFLQATILFATDDFNQNYASSTGVKIDHELVREILDKFGLLEK